MMSDIGMQSSMLQNGEFSDESMAKDIGLAMRGEQIMRYQEVGGDGHRKMDMNMYRSGSAPPTVEGSLSSVGGLFSDVSLFSEYGGGEREFVSEEELRSDPGYVKFYYANVNMNPRLPPPLVTKEDWTIAQRLQIGTGGRGGMARTTVAGNTSLFSDQLSSNGKREDKLPGLGLGNREKSLAEIFQDAHSQARPLTRQASRHVSCNAFEGNVESSESQFAQLHHKLAFFNPSISSKNIKGISSIGASASQTYASALGDSLSRSTTPDHQSVARSPSPHITAVGEGMVNSMEKRSLNDPIPYNGVSSGKLESTDLLTAFSGMNLSTNGNINEVNHLSRIEHGTHDQPRLFNMQHDQILNKQHSYLNNPEYLYHIHEPVKGMHPSMGKISGIGIADGSVELLKSDLLANSYLKGSPLCHNQNVEPLINHVLNGYAINPVSPSMIKSQIGSGNFPSSFEKAAAASSMGVSGMNSRTLGGGLATAAEFHNLSRIGNQVAGNAVNMSRVDPRYLQYLKSTEYAASQAAALQQSIRFRECMAGSQTDLLGFQKAYLGALLASQRSQYGVPYIGKASINDCYRNQEFGFGMQFPGSPLAGNFHHNSAIGPGSPVTHFLSGLRNVSGNVMGAWNDNNFDENIALSLVEEFKSNKTKCFELSEIAGHVVEFSSDQYGSRFIQQKLETATMEEKNMIFSEIMPQAFTLMTDVFGNYVIQKFFEHGTPAQIRELGMQLHGNVLTLSLQMYGCRVIQKAIEVVDLDQQTKMVSELDGNIMRCVRDQNGNHVIQKCIECIPEDVTHFIVSTFYDQVVTLSTHPYGCRVIQRVLEHCHDPKTQRIMMDEIMHWVCMLAQDQYGNYVVQHVLEHGKPHERSNIIKQLTGQIVQMSQQKFASNVVEKCLTFGDIVERQTLVTEMLGSTDENEPLQAMMKDQFANYVVQKVMETCDEHQLDLILNRIKVHLTALKKYTYGKHIVARVEKLVAAGERRISIQNMNSA